MKKIFDDPSFKYFPIWRKKYVSERNFLYMISAVVGVCAGLAAVLLKEAVELVQHYLTSATYNENYYQLLYPIVGLLITVTIARVVYKDTLGHAITDILYSVARKSSKIHASKIYSNLITSPFTVGFGGSAGLESPIVLTGAAIGSNVAQWLNMNYKNRTLLLGCGTAGVISAVFNAPITGFIFSIELILGQISMKNLIPLLIASISATLISQTILGNDVAFRFIVAEGYEAWDMLFYVGLGAFCGFFSLFFNWFLIRTEYFFARFKNSYFRALLGGLILSGLIFVVPPIYGEGYKVIMAVLNGSETELLSRSVLFGKITYEWIFLLYIVLILVLKVIATSATIAAGGSGGTFAPSLFLGALTGFAFAKLVNLTGIATISEANFALVGMCGVLSGAQYAPLTAIFLIAELTGSYALFLPLMTASALALGTVSYFESHSIYTRDIIRRGEMVDQNITLNHLCINQLIEMDLKTIHPDALLSDLVTLIAQSHRNIFPVLDAAERLKGIITLDDVREVMFDVEKQQTVKVSSLMAQPPTFARHGESIESVMQKFERTGAWNLPVIHEGKYGGFVSKARVFAYYRKKLIEQNTEV